MKIDSLHPETHYWFAVNRAKEGEMKGVLNSLFMVDELKKEANTVLKIHPNHAGAYVLLGSIYNALPSFAGGDKEKAIEYLNKAIECDSTYNAAYMTLSEILINSKKYKEARELLERFLRLKKHRDERLFHLNDKKKAEDMLKKIEGK
jgi:tetratricopeptide (TPR) repeat protein